MYVASLTLNDFRSWREVTLTLKPGVTVITGHNGRGKTNLIESLEVLAHLKSHRVASDLPLIRHGAPYARISANVINQGRELRPQLLLRCKGSNQAQLQRTKLSSPRHLLGVVKTVLFAPEDLALIKGDPSERRRFLDEIVASQSPRLWGVKADYEKILRQRNALLKTASGKRHAYSTSSYDTTLSTLDVWDEQLAVLGAQLICARLRLLEELKRLTTITYEQIAPESRSVSMRYLPSAPMSCEVASLSSVSEELVEATLLQALGTNREKELDRGITLIGPHRDEVEFLLGSNPAKGYASHGETWSYALALRLATAAYYREHGDDPIVLLDDVFAELDAKRRRRLVGAVIEAQQVLITAAVGDDLPVDLSATDPTRFSVDMIEDSADPGRMISTICGPVTADTDHEPPPIDHDDLAMRDDT